MSKADGNALADILIADDVPVNLRLLSDMLTQQGYLVRAVLDGPQAVAVAQRMPPDIILLDIRMPEMDGYQVCQLLKADERTQQIPIIFISALNDADDIVKAFEAGGVDYITKPFHLQEVLARVQTHLTIQQMRRDMEQQIADLRAYAHTVAHDLRSPLSIALGAAELLADQEIPQSEAEIVEFANMLTKSLRKANNIISELLLLAEVRQAEIQMEPVQMACVVEESLQRVAGLLQDAGGVATQPDTWQDALGHAPWIEEIWVNYLTNAIKYGGAPPVIELGASPQADGTVRYWVRDRGPGLSAEQQTGLFTPFSHVEHVRATGHGLGLSIVRRIAGKLNGRVGVESSGIPGQGSTFFFVLPAAN